MPPEYLSFESTREEAIACAISEARMDALCCGDPIVIVACVCNLSSCRQKRGDGCQMCERIEVRPDGSVIRCGGVQ